MSGFATVTVVDAAGGRLMASTQILAHQGGWDEALYVLGPLVIIGLLLLLANRRADAARRGSDGGSDPADTDDA